MVVSDHKEQKEAKKINRDARTFLVAIVLKQIEVYIYIYIRISSEVTKLKFRKVEKVALKIVSSTVIFLSMYHLYEYE